MSYSAQQGRDNHASGAIYQMAVASQLMSMGARVSFPCGDHSRYDLVADLPDGRMVRVQVKGTQTWDGKRACIHAQPGTKKNGNGSARKPYTRDDFDYYVGVVAQTGNYYVACAADLETMGAMIYPRPSDPSCPLSEYKDAWHKITLC